MMREKRIAFGTKAETLQKLEGTLGNAKVLPQLLITKKNWDNKGIGCLRDDTKGWLSESLIVRSSAQSEDSGTESLAGKFDSVADVKGIDAIQIAVGKVFDSFSDLGSNDQVFIQPMLQNVLVSGVLFTSDVNTGAPYYVINYDETSGLTDSVTSGRGSNLKTFYHAKCSNYEGEDWRALAIETAIELQHKFGSSFLDIEFAVSQSGEFYVLQVRPLVTEFSEVFKADDHLELLERIKNKIRCLDHLRPRLKGDRSVYGIMPDWNPAEIIGVRPRPLALSIYKELITDSIWAYQRSNYGYRDLRSFPLMVNFSGLPYIDVRVSFNSFIPSTLSDDLAEKLVNYYITRLLEYPKFHDKVEFEIIHSCYSLDLPQRLEPLLKQGFSQEECEEIKNSLRNLTNNIIHQDGLWKQDIEKVNSLEARHNEITNSDLNDIEKIYWLTENCKRHGTLPFAGLARAGFIAVQLVHSLVSVGIFTDHDVEEFMNSLDTVSSALTFDFSSLEPEVFLAKYGHLRPGTYDILSPRYDEEPNLYFDWEDTRPLGGGATDKKDFKPSLKALSRIADLLKDHKLDHNILSFFEFIKSAIEGREYAKFVFTKSLSEMLRLLSEQGGRLGFTKDDMSYANLKIVEELYSSSFSAREVFQRSITQGKRISEDMNAVCLPPLLTCEQEVTSFELPVDEPNFITLKTVIADIANHEREKQGLKSKIVMITSADPGYDWIFSKGIAGFVTMYGGANSHMAIRAAELGLPAVIGAGETLYNNWLSAKKLAIDCAARTVRIIS